MVYGSFLENVSQSPNLNKTITGNKVIRLICVKHSVKLERNVVIYELLSAPNADIGENKCGTINGKVGFIHCQQPCNIKMWTVTSSC